LLAQLFLVKASLPQFRAASSSFVAIVIAVVARPYPDASGANVNLSENAAVGMATIAAVAIAKM
jgi:hypothetical protein